MIFKVSTFCDFVLVTFSSFRLLGPFELQLWSLGAFIWSPCLRFLPFWVPVWSLLGLPLAIIWLPLVPRVSLLASSWHLLASFWTPLASLASFCLWLRSDYAMSGRSDTSTTLAIRHTYTYAAKFKKRYGLIQLKSQN